MTPARPGPRSLRGPEVGASVISATLGFVVAMTFLMMSVHVVLALHTRSIVRAAAWDAARAVARHPTHDRAAGRTRLAATIGGLRPVQRWSQEPGGSIRLEVVVRRPGLAPFGVLRSLSTTSVAVVVREERWR